MHPELSEIEEVHFEGATLYGISADGALINSPTRALWKRYRHALTGARPKALINLQDYPEGYHENFNPSTPFTHWAGTFQHPAIAGSSTFIIPEGKYLKLLRKGNPNDGSVFHYIFTELLPARGLRVDHRPHFEILGESYDQGAPVTEEEIWIPVASI